MARRPMTWKDWTFIGVLVIGLLSATAFSAYRHFNGPRSALLGAQKAVQEHDRDAFERHVDAERLIDQIAGIITEAAVRKRGSREGTSEWRDVAGVIVRTNKKTEILQDYKDAFAGVDESSTLFTVLGKGGLARVTESVERGRVAEMTVFTGLAVGDVRVRLEKQDDDRWKILEIANEKDLADRLTRMITTDDAPSPDPTPAITPKPIPTAGD